jgi:hypothetical protein
MLRQVACPQVGFDHRSYAIPPVRQNTGDVRCSGGGIETPTALLTRLQPDRGVFGELKTYIREVWDDYISFIKADFRPFLEECKKDKCKRPFPSSWDLD